MMKKNIVFAFTISRVVIALILFMLLLNPQSALLIWICFILIELSDVLDGQLARWWKVTSDVGKLLDPFCDVLSRGGILLGLAFLGVVPSIAMLLIFYREIIMLGLRMIMAKQQKIVAANAGGKVKTVFYSFTIGLGIFAYLHNGSQVLVVAFAWASAALAWASLLFYTLQAMRLKDAAKKDQ